MISCLYGIVILQAAVLSSSNILSNGLVWHWPTHPIFDFLNCYFISIQSTSYKTYSTKQVPEQRLQDKNVRSPHSYFIKGRKYDFQIGNLTPT